MSLTSKDLSFVGYTYKNFDAVKALRNSSDPTRDTSPRRPSIDSIFKNSKDYPSTKGTGGEIDTEMITSTGYAISP
ncbi:hypothetical protein H5410_041718 [Solanum commersonii]|uniref:Uncharacterized protein n=1 Tax=Solanum commersonii TaxID=4109 RepID=A0A9J5XVD8_SOLCO|nr:hypothetical protein H5410_041718 [Solanum commersonii]